jgi:predicted acylesterase/phospholipase RssA
MIVQFRFSSSPTDRAGILLAFVVLSSLSGCSIPQRLPAVPEDLTAEASIPGMPGIRYFLNEDVEEMYLDVLEAKRLERAHLAASGRSGTLPPAHFLALSGGGDNGAFGAGLLAGWSEAGNRPEFLGVTGISIGAVIAPFAFIGSSQDELLRDFFTTLRPEDVYEKRSMFAVLYDDAVADSAPMKELLEKYVTEALLTRVSEEYAKGRWLLILTTDLDSDRPVVWNMGKLATSDDPGALQLFRDVIRASASVSGAFPPVMIDVEVDGVHYQEMHVDGGICAQVFLFPLSITRLIVERELDTDRERHAYIIRNAQLGHRWNQIERSTLDILSHSISSLIQAQGVGDLFRIYLNLQQQKVDFNLAFIGADFDAEHPEEFDTEYMRALYAYGLEAGREGYPWLKSPQELVTHTDLSLAHRGGDCPTTVALE